MDVKLAQAAAPRSTPRRILAATTFIMALSAAIPAARSAADESSPTGTPKEDAPPRAAIEDPEPAWSESLGKLPTAGQGLQFRLHALRTEFQSWELPTFTIEVRNRTEEPISAELLASVFRNDANPDGLQFLFRDAHRRPTNINRWLVPEVRIDLQKFVGLKPGEVMRTTATLTQMREQSAPLWDPLELIAGRYTIGLGVIRVNPEVELKTNSVTLQMLPPGVQHQDDLDRFLKPYEAGKHRVKAGFVPNGTTLVLGESIFATFVVENEDEEPFTFGFGGDYRGSGRHDRFTIEIVDAEGWQLEDPIKNRFEGGGILMNRTAAARDKAVETVEFAKYRTITKPGKYQVTCRFTLTPSWNDRGQNPFEVPVETTYELTILPHEPANVAPVLAKLFAECDQTAGLSLTKLVDVISTFGAEAAIAGLSKMGVGGDVEHRVAAARGLGKIAAPEAVAALLQLNHDTSIEVRVAAIASLGAFTDASAVNAVVQALVEPDELIQRTAATSLGQMKTDAATKALLTQLSEATPEVRGVIIRALGTTKAARAFEIVVQSLNDKNTTIRYAALDAILNFPPDEAAKALRPYAATDGNMDFREAVIQKLAEHLRQPIEMEWLTPVIKSRKGTNTIGDAPRIMRLYGGDKAVPALVSCLDFENPSIRNYYNITIIENQLPCRGPLAIPWHGDLNRDGAPAEIEENRRTLNSLKGWVNYYQSRQIQDDELPWNANRDDDKKSWGDAVDDLSIRARAHRSIWPANLPQVVSIEARKAPAGGSVFFNARPEIMEIEVNSEWYALPAGVELSVSGEWKAYHGQPWHDLQINKQWRRKSDDKPLELEPGLYTLRVAISQLPAAARTGLAISRPVKFKVIANEQND